MKSSLCAWVLLAAGAMALAHAGVPVLDAECPGGISVQAGRNGTVYVNGKESALKRFGDDYHEARDATSGVVISIAGNSDGTAAVSYTGRNRAHGVCKVSEPGAGNQVTASTPAPVVHGKGQFPAAEKACLEAVARKTGVHRGKLSITDVSWAHAGVGITVKVPGAEAPWSCLANQKGRVQGVRYTGGPGRI